MSTSTPHHCITLHFVNNALLVSNLITAASGTIHDIFHYVLHGVTSSSVGESLFLLTSNVISSVRRSQYGFPSASCGAADKYLSNSYTLFAMHAYYPLSTISIGQSTS